MKDAPLKLYVDKKSLSEDYAYSPLLFPFWKEDPALKVLRPTFFKTAQFDKSCYALVDEVRDADLTFLPYNYWFLKRRDPRFLNKLIEGLLALKKPILIDAYGDSMDQIDVPQSFILRLGQYRSRLKPNDIIMPTFTEDLLESYFGGRMVLRKKETIPLIGFAGWVETPFYKYPRMHLRDLGLRFLGFFDERFNLLRKGVFWRKKAVKVLEGSPFVRTSFIKRSFYSGHTKTAEGDIESLRHDFVENIVNCDYVLDVRGDANQSTRFYEALSMGRVPVFVDTERVMPLEDILRYRDFCLFVDYREIRNLDKIIVDFHRSISDDKFQEMQKKARNAFENYLRIDKFSKYLFGKLKALVSHYNL